MQLLESTPLNHSLPTLPSFSLPVPILYLGIPCALVKLMESDLCIRKKRKRKKEGQGARAQASLWSNEKAFATQHPTQASLRSNKRPLQPSIPHRLHCGATKRPLQPSTPHTIPFHSWMCGLWPTIIIPTTSGYTAEQQKAFATPAPHTLPCNIFHAGIQRRTREAPGVEAGVGSTGALAREVRGGQDLEGVLVLAGARRPTAGLPVVARDGARVVIVVGRGAPASSEKRGGGMT